MRHVGGGEGKIRRTKYVKNFLCEGVGGEKNAKTLKKKTGREREGGGDNKSRRKTKSKKLNESTYAHTEKQHFALHI